MQEALAYIFIMICGISLYIYLSIKISQKNTDAVEMAVNAIEQAAGVVEENIHLLGYDTVAMNKEGNSFTVEFYGFNSAYKKNIAEILNFCGYQWKVTEDVNRDLCIKCDFETDYKGGWSRFNNQVWDEVKRRHPYWDIEKINLHNSILKVLP